MREQLSLDSGWRFHLGDIDIPYPTQKGPVYTQAKTETAIWGPAARNYNDRSDAYQASAETCTIPWETVDLPHDYIIGQYPQERFNESLGFVEYHNAWYRRKFQLEEKDSDKRITLYFEGIATHATVYINGCLAARHFDGHTSFEVDVTDFILFNQDNLIAVYVSTEQHEGWWYSGGGIYRHVWLVKTEKVSVDRYGIYVSPRHMDGDIWKIPVETSVRNDGAVSQTVKVLTDILNNEGVVLTHTESIFTIPPYSIEMRKQISEVHKPRLWDTDDPYQHYVRTVLQQNGQETDRVETRFGFRDVSFDANRGLFLNGRQVKIKGICCHQDYGLTGIAVPDSVQRYKLRLMEEMGANGFRAVHYPHSENTMDALDEMGFLVMDETRWFSTNEESVEALEWLVRRDRNRPGVIMWSIGNEEPITLTENGRRIALKLKEAVKKLDRSRPVTMAIDKPVDNKTAGELDLIGVNYNLDRHDELHDKYPDIPLFLSECCATGTTRGWHLNSCAKRGYISDYDRDSNSWFRSREQTWKHTAAREWLFGAYQWAGVEHRGEAVWPRLCSQSGAVDLYLLKKSAFYQNQSHWLNEPMIHLLPHWNHAGREGDILPVWAYTNCDEAELLVDGTVISRVAVEPYGHAAWEVTYRPGTLTARGYRQGKVVAEDTRETTGAPASLALRVDNAPAADGYAVLTAYCIDTQGRFVPDAEIMLAFDCDGGTVIATGSDIADHVPPACPDRRMRAGQCALLIRLNPEAETAAVFVRAPGVTSARLVVRRNANG